jgi:hypothetical protein
MTILWLIERLLTKPVEGSNTDVVITADWRCNGSQESLQRHLLRLLLIRPAD